MQPMGEKLKADNYSFLQNNSYYANLTAFNTKRVHSNCIANKHMGFVITECGGGFSFYNNSYKKKISHFSQDSILDPPSEFIEICEGESVFSITKKPHTVNAKYQTIHGLGYSEFTNAFNGLRSTQTVFLSKTEAIKYFVVKIENKTSLNRNLKISFNIKPVLGDFYEKTKHTLIAKKEDTQIYIKNAFNKLSCFIHCNKKIEELEKHNEKKEFFPKMSSFVSIAPHAYAEIIYAISPNKTVNLNDYDFQLEVVKNYFLNLSSVQLKGNCPNHILLSWLPYQTLCSRFHGKAGFFQAGGATGFRDQLQDCLSLLYIDPLLVKEHILSCAKRQFEKGDVLHWWHQPNIGVRTKMTDDRLFLPIVVAEYIEFTGDNSILDEFVSYLENEEIPPLRHDLYKEFISTERYGTIREHCERAIEVSFDFGNGGLNKIGTGDWNDAMDKVGENGEGTSVFVSMLLYHAIKKFMPFVKSVEKKKKYLEIAEGLQLAVDEAFCGDRYLRAVTDSGDMLGTQSSPEGKIDLLCAAWASLSDIGKKEKVKLALNTAHNYLVDYETQIIKLLSPPFSKMQNVGYISKYPKGVRENGGQYTHAACWYIMALIKEGEIEKAYKLFSMLNPINKTISEKKYNIYKSEPYYLCGDVYTSGQGGWSAYTGAATWYYKAYIEGFLGIKIKKDQLSINPKLPVCINEVEFSYRHEAGLFNFLINNTKKKGEWQLRIGKLIFNSETIPLNSYTLNETIIIERKV